MKNILFFPKPWRLLSLRHLLFFLLASGALVSWGQKTTGGSGNFSGTVVNTPWTTVGAPAVTDVCTINSGHTVTLSASATLTNPGSLTVYTGGIFSTGSTTRTLSGTGTFTLDGGTIQVLHTNGLKGALTISTTNWLSGTIRYGTSISTGLAGIYNTTDFSNFDLLITAGTATLDRDVTVKSLKFTGGSLALNGFTLTVLGDITTSANDQINGSVANSKIVMGGSIAQSMGNFTLNNLRDLQINNSGAGVSINKAVTLSGALTMTSGALNIGGNDITAETVSGGSISSYVNQTSGGHLLINYFVGETNTFPVFAAGGYYPTTINLSGGSGTGTLKVDVTSGKMTGLGAADVVYANRYWTVTNTTITSPVIGITNTNVVGGDLVGSPATTVGYDGALFTGIGSFSGTALNATGMAFATTLKFTAVEGVPPVVSTLTPSTVTLLDINAGVGTFTIAVLFNELMRTDGSADPTISFPTSGENPAGAGMITFTGGVWTSTATQSTYTATYNVTDTNSDILNIDVQVGGVRDKFGTAMVAPSLLTNKFSCRFKNPVVVSIVPNLTLITDANCTASAFNLKITYDIAITSTAGLAISFPVENPAGTFGAPVISGVGTTTITATYTPIDANIYLADIDVKVVGGNNNGAIATDYTGADIFSINTDKPHIVGITATPTPLQESNVGAGKFKITVIYDLVMNTTINPTLSFPVENPGGMVTFSSGAWTDTKTYVGTFDVQDLNYNLANIDIGAASGKSGTGVFQVDGVVANVFSITTSITGIITVDDSGGADYTSISAAVAAAPDGALIMVADGTYNENLLLGSKAVVIKGNTTTPGSVILHGTGTSSTLTIENSAKKIDLQGMIIENGIGSLRDFTDANKHGQIGYYGGGVIIAAASNVSFSYVWVRNNTVGQYAPFHNGGSGGGIYIGRSSTVKITNCKIYSNTADAYRGAGICVDKSNVTIKTTDINNNSGSRYGGGIAAYDATIIFDTVNIFSNACGSVQSRGGGYYFHKSASSITLGSCSGNSAITNPQLEIY